MPSNRKNLIIVRAGDTSLHESWLNDLSSEARSWDLIVSYFGDDPARYRAHDTVRVDSKGPKWLALHDLLSTLGTQLDQYDYVWLPDDDLEIPSQSTNKVFQWCRDFNLAFAQPALTPDSYISHLITLRNPRFSLRLTTFVEIMAPCFRRDILMRVIPTMAENLSGWGLDYLWSRLISESGGRLGSSTRSLCGTRGRWVRRIIARSPSEVLPGPRSSTLS